MSIVINEIAPEDGENLLSIYGDGIRTGQATFETRAPNWTVWEAGHLDRPRLAARLSGQLVGWAALSPVSAREVYAGVCEVSIYIALDHRGTGVGKALMEKLVKASESLGIWTLQASIFPENQASVRLHQSAGFRIVGRRERIAKLHGVWRDTFLMERRSDLPNL